VKDDEPDEVGGHLAQRQVVPFDFAGYQGLKVDEFLGFEFDIQIDRIRGSLGLLSSWVNRDYLLGIRNSGSLKVF
jgi:hypothetical protein